MAIRSPTRLYPLRAGKVWGAFFPLVLGGFQARACNLQRLLPSTSHMNVRPGSQGSEAGKRGIAPSEALLLDVTPRVSILLPSSSFSPPLSNRKDSILVAQTFSRIFEVFVAIVSTTESFQTTIEHVFYH